MKIPRCRATVSESLAEGHCANGKAPAAVRDKIATRKPGDRRELTSPTPFACEGGMSCSRSFRSCSDFSSLLCCYGSSRRRFQNYREEPCRANVSPACRSAYFAPPTTPASACANYRRRRHRQLSPSCRWRLPRGDSGPGIRRTVATISLPQTQTLTVELKLATTPQTVVVSATATPATAGADGHFGRRADQRAAQR